MGAILGPPRELQNSGGCQEAGKRDSQGGGSGLFQSLCCSAVKPSSSSNANSSLCQLLGAGIRARGSHVSNMIESEINAILAIVIFAGYLACMRYMIRQMSCIERSITQSQCHSREQIRRELIAQLETHYNSRSIIRMRLLRDNQYSIVEEQVAKFLHILSGHSSTQAEGFFFRRSTETISRYFHQVRGSIFSSSERLNCPTRNIQ
ncbi:hypothetical protein AHAS_Ahas13G0260900 [Arachis hypogaea]